MFFKNCRFLTLMYFEVIGLYLFQKHLLGNKLWNQKLKLKKRPAEHYTILTLCIKSAICFKAEPFLSAIFFSQLLLPFTDKCTLTDFLMAAATKASFRWPSSSLGDKPFAWGHLGGFLETSVSASFSPFNIFRDCVTIWTTELVVKLLQHLRVGTL